MESASYMRQSFTNFSYTPEMIESVEVPGLTATLMPEGRYGLIACYSDSATTADIFIVGLAVPYR